MKKMNIKNASDKRFYDFRGLLKRKILKDIYNTVIVTEDIPFSIKCYLVHNSLEEFLKTKDKSLLEIATNADPSLSCYNSACSFFKVIKYAKADKLFQNCLDELMDEYFPDIEYIDQLQPQDLNTLMSAFGFTFHENRLGKEKYNRAMFNFCWGGCLALDEVTYMELKDFKKFMKDTTRQEFDDFLFLLSPADRDDIYNDIHGVKAKITTRKYSFYNLDDFIESYPPEVIKRINSTDLINGFRKTRQDTYSINYFFAPDIDSFVFILNSRPGCLQAIAISKDECAVKIKKELSTDLKFNVKETFEETNTATQSYNEYVESARRLNETCGLPSDQDIYDEATYIRYHTNKSVTLPLG